MKKGRPVDPEIPMRIYRTMIEYQYETGFNMTLRELMEKLGYKTTSAVNYHVKWLKKNGYVVSKGNQIRAIRKEELK